VKTIKLFWKKEEGVSMVVSAILLTMLMGFLGLAMDVGNLVYTKTCMQSAVDAGACAGALALPNQATATTQATTFLNNNLQKHGLSSVTPTVTFTQNTTKNPNNYPEINVSISQNVPTYIIKVLNPNKFTTVPLSASAEAIVKSGSTGPFTYSIFSNNNLTIGPAAMNITGSLHTNGELTINGAENISGAAEGYTGVNLTGAGNIGSVVAGTVQEITDSGAFNIGSESGGAQNISLSNYNYTQQIEQTAAQKITGPYTQSGAISLTGNIYVTGGTNGTVTLNGAINDTGSILADGNITVTGAANFSGSGQLFLYSANGNITISGADNFGTGSSSVILYAPNGTITFNNVASNINGSLVANTITMSNCAFNVTGGVPITALSLGGHAILIN